MKAKYIPIGLLAVLVLVQVYAMVFRVDSWPVSDYPMFSHLKTPANTTALQLRARRHDGTTFMVPLTGGKHINYVYRTMEESKNFDGLKTQMLADLERYLNGNAGIQRADLAEIDLVKMGMDAGQKDFSGSFQEQLVYRVSL